MVDFIKQLEFLRAGGDVTRMHTIRTARKETVAEHSFGVAWLCFQLSGGAPSANLLLAALAHDVPEGVVGDIPSPAKRAMGGVAKKEVALYEEKLLVDHDLHFELTAREADILELADILDGLMFCLRSVQAGDYNPNGVRLMAHNYITYFNQCATSNEYAHKIFEYIVRSGGLS